MAGAREVADQHLSDWAGLDPVQATMAGLLGHEREMTDYSPDGIASRRELAQRTLTELQSATVGSDDERRCGALLAERLLAELAVHEINEPLRDLNTLFSPLQESRMAFDLMGRDSDDDWETVAARLECFPASLAGYEVTLRAGLDLGLTAALRQVEGAIEQALTWSGQREARPYFEELVAGGPVDDALSRRLEAAASEATAAYGRMATFLKDIYAPRATREDSVGSDRYTILTRRFLGCDVDPVETYGWGWAEVHRIEAEMATTAALIRPGASVAEVVALLEADPERCIEGVEPFRQWMQDLQDQTIEALQGRHFDIPEPVRRVEAKIAPAGSAAAMYYTAPSEDFRRPGRTWYPTLGKTRFALWGEVTTAHHEGVPGHHLQIAQVQYLAERLASYQRTTFVSGHGEGWALYAERLMDELGFLDNPDYRLGMLRGQLFRAIRVVVDIGMHLGLTIPDDEAFRPGERWTPALGEEFVVGRTHLPEDFLASEITRYLGTPAQAISYKVGERVWLDCRGELQRRGDFDLKRFHAQALDLGPLGLDLLRAELLAL
jgi:uncharacterized protein (DUF885 family)